MDVERGEGADREGSLWARPQNAPAPEVPDDAGRQVWLPPSPGPPPETAASADLVDAGWWYRLLAFCVDVAAAIVIGLVISLAVLVVFAGSEDAAVALALLALVAGWVIVTSWVTAKTGGQSLGKWIGAMRVVGDDGRPATFGSSLLRDLVFRVPYVLPLYAIVDGLFAAGAERKALHDRMAGTRVVRLAGYERRLIPLLAAVAVAAVAWVAVGAVGRNSNNGYTRGEFVHDCTGGAYDSGRCGCVYDAMIRDFGRDTVDGLETIDRATRRTILEASVTLHGC